MEAVRAPPNRNIRPPKALLIKLTRTSLILSLNQTWAELWRLFFVRNFVPINYVRRHLRTWKKTQKFHRERGYGYGWRLGQLPQSQLFILTHASLGIFYFSLVVLRRL